MFAYKHITSNETIQGPVNIVRVLLTKAGTAELSDGTNTIIKFDSSSSTGTYELNVSVGSNVTVTCTGAELTVVYG